MERFPTLEELRPCQILFISASERGRLKEIVETIAGDHVLTVGEMDGFAQRWGIVNFQVTGNKVRFEINRARAQRAGLRISSRLLRVATIVNDDLVRSTAGGN